MMVIYMKEIMISDLDKNQPMICSSVQFKSLKSYSYFLSIECYIKFQFNKLCSRKVESHIILTRSLFLMNHFDIYVDFENKKVFLVNNDNLERYVRYSCDKELYKILSVILYQSGYNSDDSFEYEDYRNETRKIFDNLDMYDNKPMTNIWNDLIDLSIEWFNL